MHFNILYSFTFFILFSIINMHFNSVLLLFVCLFANTHIVFKHLNTYLILIDIDFGTHSLYPDLFSLCFLACTFHVVSFGWPFSFFLRRLTSKTLPLSFRSFVRYGRLIITCFSVLFLCFYDVPV